MDDVAAILLVDIVASTELTERLGEAAARLWTEHDRVARDLFTELGGHEIDKTDGFLILFDDATSAVTFAGRYHETIGRLNPPMRARAAIHVARLSRRITPDVDVARGAKRMDIDALAKAVVARVLSAAAAGQTLTTEAGATALRSSSLAICSAGCWRMKGLEEPLALFELVLSTEHVDLPVDSEKAFRVAKRGETWLPLHEVAHSLPIEVASFVGRRASS